MTKNSIVNKKMPKNQRCDCVIHLFKHKNCIKLCKCQLKTKKQFDMDVQRTYAQVESRELT